MENKYYIIVLSVLFLSLMLNCGNRSTNTDKVVEFRLYWISDTYPKKTENAKETDMRFQDVTAVIFRLHTRAERSIARQ